MSGAADPVRIRWVIPTGLAGAEHHGILETRRDEPLLKMFYEKELPNFSIRRDLTEERQETYTDEDGAERCDDCEELTEFCFCVCDDCGDPIHECACDGGWG